MKTSVNGEVKTRCSACGGRTQYNEQKRVRFVEGWGQLCKTCWDDLKESYPFPRFLERRNFTKQPKSAWEKIRAKR